MNNLQSLPLLASYFNKTIKANHATEQDLSNAFEVVGNMNIEGLWFKTYRKVRLFNTESKYELTYVLDDTPENRKTIIKLKGL
jgi:hypothetical protein